MAKLTPCPLCGLNIEDDSIFCDQCGAELLKCPKCGNFRKGKFCPTCGVPTVKIAASGPATGPAPQQPQPVQPQPIQPQPRPAQPQAIQPQAARPQPQPIQPQPQVVQPQPQPIQPMSSGTSIPGAGAAPQPSRLFYRAMGIALPLQPGAIIGRVVGNYTGMLGSLSYISGTHARLDFNGSQWTITDLGSRNGTTVNGMACAPNQPLPIKLGDLIKFAKSYDFFVE